MSQRRARNRRTFNTTTRCVRRSVFSVVVNVKQPEDLLPTQFKERWLWRDRNALHHDPDQLYSAESSRDSLGTFARRSFISDAAAQLVNNQFDDIDEYSFVIDDGTDKAKATTSSPFKKEASKSDDAFEKASTAIEDVSQNKYTKVNDVTNTAIEYATQMESVAVDDVVGKETTSDYDVTEKLTTTVDSVMENENVLDDKENIATDTVCEASSLVVSSFSAEQEKQQSLADTSVLSTGSRASFVIKLQDPNKQRFYLQDYDGDADDLSQLCYVCDQPRVLEWTDVSQHLSFNPVLKLGEGAFGEVFKAVSDGVSVALKIFPFQESNDPSNYYPIVNESEMIRASAITTELVVTKELSNLSKREENQTQNFVELVKTWVVKGDYPVELVKAWEVANRKKRSDNSHPNTYSSPDRHYIVMALGLGGQDLEHFQVVGEQEALSIFLQVTISLAVAEQEIEFEHRDLHWGNILITRDQSQDTLSYLFNGAELKINTCGIIVRIIDFTLSRIYRDGTIVYSDLSKDPALFEQEVVDKQFQVYKDMREVTNDRWDQFCPKTNCLWLDYLADKLFNGVPKVNLPKKIPLKRRKELYETLKVVREFASAGDFIRYCDSFNDLVKDFVIV